MNTQQETEYATLEICALISGTLSASERDQVNKIIPDALIGCCWMIIAVGVQGTHYPPKHIGGIAAGQAFRPMATEKSSSQT